MLHLAMLNSAIGDMQVQKFFAVMAKIIIQELRPVIRAYTEIFFAMSDLIKVVKNVLMITPPKRWNVITA